MENRFIRLLVGFIIKTNNRLQILQTSCWIDHKLRYSDVIFLLDLHKNMTGYQRDLKYDGLTYNSNFVSHPCTNYNINSSKFPRLTLKFEVF